ncbi:MAG: hypothetical protein ACJAYF_003194 [Arenicella sp.]|jgi:hypothetical protein
MRSAAVTNQKKAPIRIAMWSGPRNISTAMMRSWESRADTTVIDEPFYAAYLRVTGMVHPMQGEVLASQSSDWAEVIKNELQNELLAGQSIQYQKHMTQHMVTDLDHDWFSSLRHAFLIRSPEQVVVSYGAKRESITADDIGFAKQKELYDKVVALSGQKPPVIDAKDVLSNPANVLQKLCHALDVKFDQNMLSWSAGPRESDGVWAAHWYHHVEKSTGFGPYQAKQFELSKQQQRVVDQSLPYYLEMYNERIVAD